jgi:hypothetical protein
MDLEQRCNEKVVAIVLKGKEPHDSEEPGWDWPFQDSSNDAA